MKATNPLALFAIVALAMPALAAPKEPAARPAEKAVKQRTGFAVRWQQDVAAREAGLAEVRTLLKKPLTVNRAVQIALLNNHDLLATFEDGGVSAADLRETGLWKNPSFDLSGRFPDRPPTGANWEEAVAFDLLDLLMLPLRKRAAADYPAAAQLRVADKVVRLVAEVKTGVYQPPRGWRAARAPAAHRGAPNTVLALAQRQHEAPTRSPVFARSGARGGSFASGLNKLVSFARNTAALTANAKPIGGTENGYTESN